MLVSSFFFLKNNYKTKNTYSSCLASKWQFPLALTKLPLVNTSGRVQFSSPVLIHKRKMKIEVPMASYGSLKIRGHKDPLTLFRLMEFSIKTPYYKVSMVHCIYQQIISVKNGPPRGFWDLGRMAIYFQGSREHW